MCRKKRIKEKITFFANSEWNLVYEKKAYGKGFPRLNSISERKILS